LFFTFSWRVTSLLTSMESTAKESRNEYIMISFDRNDKILREGGRNRYLLSADRSAAHFPLIDRATKIWNGPLAASARFRRKVGTRRTLRIFVTSVRDLRMTA
jgi:hypothetical protein